MAEKRLSSKVLTWRGSIAESDLPRTTRAVAWALANYMNDRGESAFPGVPRLARDVGNERGDGPASKTTVINALRELQESGYLVRAARGGGRAKRGEWHARLPEERVQQLNPNEAEAGSGSASAAALVDGAAEASGGPATGNASPEQRVQPLNPLSKTETVQSRDERVQSALENGSAAEPEVEVLEVDQEVEQQQPRAREGQAAAAEVEKRLGKLRIVGELRDQALADPERADAWLELAATEARRNPAGLFRAGFETGVWPSPRIEPTGNSATARMDAKRKSIEQLAKLEIDPDEIRYMIDVEWDTLADVERNELNEYLSELLSGGPVEKPELRAVDAA